MKTKQYRSLGFVSEFEVPASVAEFDANAKKEGACLDNATDNVVYRGSLTEWRDLFLHGREAVAATATTPAIPEFKGVEQLSGIPRKTKKVKKGDKEVEVYDESEQEYKDRVCGRWESDEQPPAKWAEVARAAAKLVRFDASAAERVSGPKKLPEIYSNTAKAALAAGNGPKLVAMFKKDLGKEVVLTGDPVKDAEILGWAIRDHKLWRDRDDLAKTYGSTMPTKK